MATVGSNSHISIGGRDANYCGIWSGGVTRTADNYSILSGTGAVLINSPDGADSVQIRNGNQKNVAFSASPVAYGILGDATAANMGGYSTASWAIWAGNVVPTNQNYSFWMNGDATQAEVNATTEVILGINNVTKLTVDAADVITTNSRILIDAPPSTVGYLQSTSGLSGNCSVGHLSASSNDMYVTNADSTASILLQTNVTTRLTISTAAITAALPIVTSTNTSTAAGGVYQVANRGLVAFMNGPRLMVGTVFRGATAVTLTASTSETALSTTAAWGTVTLPANILQAGTQVRVRLMINITNASVANTLTIRVKIGGTTVWAFASVTHTTLPHCFEVNAYTAAAPSASSVVMAGGYCDGYFADSGIIPNNLATTASLAVTATMQWAFNNASSVTGYIAGIDIL